MMRMLAFVLIPCCLLNIAILQAAESENHSITNGTVTMTWDEEKSQVEIADIKGVYAVVPFENGTQCRSVPSSKSGGYLELVTPESKRICIDNDQPGQNPRWVCFYGTWDDENNPDVRLPEIELQLPQNADTLKSFGTAGLKAVDRHNGSYMFLSIVDPQTNAGIVSGWTTAFNASGIVHSGKTKNSKAFILPESRYGNVTDRMLGEKFVMSRFDDCREGLEQYAELLGKEAKVQLKPIPAGYCTWYSEKHGGSCDEIHIRELADFADEHLKPYGFNFIQIDDHWQDGVQTNGPKKIFTRVNPKGPYPDGMTPTAKMLAERGFTAGLWFMPFAGNVDDPHFPKDWYVKSTVADEVNENGKSKRHYNSIVNKKDEPYESFWGGTSLDMTNPDVQEYLREEVKQIYSDWGYNYFKLDGLWTGMACDQLYVNNEYKPDDFGRVKFFDKNKYTPISAYRKGFEIIRETAPDAFILGCNVSQNMRMMHPSIGFCDAMRIGPDNGSDWNSLKRGPWHGSNRYFLNGRVWWNDPDPVYVRASMPIEHAQLIASWVAVSGQLYAFSDWLPDLPRDRLEILQKTIRPHGLKTARPVDLFESDLPKIWTLTDNKSGITRTIVAFYNWDDKNPTTIETTAEKLGLPQAKQYVAFDYWNDQGVAPFDGKNICVELPPGSCKIWSVRPIVGNQPILLGTSSHVTQGIIDVMSEKWDIDNRILKIELAAFNTEPVELRFYDRSVITGDQNSNNVTGFVRRIVTPTEVGKIVHVEYDGSK